MRGSAEFEFDHADVYKRQRYDLSDELAARLGAIDAITDAVTGG